MASVDNRYKLLTDMDGMGGNDMLFDLIRDPSETTNIAAQQPDIVKSMKVRLVEFRESCKHSLAGKDYAVPFTPDKARLRVARYGGRIKALKSENQRENNYYL